MLSKSPYHSFNQIVEYFQKYNQSLIIKKEERKFFKICIDLYLDNIIIVEILEET